MASLFEQHKVLISTTLQHKFHIESQDLDISEFKNAKNNHVYLVEILATGSSQLFRRFTSKPYTSPIPKDTSRLIFRVPCDNVSLEDSVRIRNEVAFLALASDALSAFGRSLIPKVYDWEDQPGSGSDALNGRWIMQEWKQGEVLDVDKFRAFSPEDQDHVLTQIAQAVKYLQDFELPEGARLFGGLTFESNGKISNTQSSIPCGGPFSTYGDFVQGMCQWQLEASERSTHLNGWKEFPELRQRLDAFFKAGLKDVISQIPDYNPCLVHADIGFSNLLFDTNTLDLTAVLDFDFSHVGAPVSEFLFSFLDVGGILPGSIEPHGQLRKWILNGFPKRTDKATRVPKAWDNALAKVGSKKSSDIKGAGNVADIWWFSQELCQAYWFMDRFMARQTPETLAKLKARSAQDLDKYLKLWGF